MSDTYFDDGEIDEYGTHFVNEVKKLTGVSDLVDIKALGARVDTAMKAVAAERQNAGLARADVRTGRLSTADATAAARDDLTRFFRHVQSLPKAAAVDVEALFTGKILGNLSVMKPADVKGKLDDVLLGFSVPANAPLSQTTWKADMTTARDNLATALKGKGSAHGASITSTAALDTARQQFFTAYGPVAKRLVYGVLADLGRTDEYALFFKDLQVNEDGSKKPAPAKPEAQAPAAAPPVATPPGNGKP